MFWFTVTVTLVDRSDIQTSEDLINLKQRTEGEETSQKKARAHQESILEKLNNTLKKWRWGTKLQLCS